MRYLIHFMMNHDILGQCPHCKVILRLEHVGIHMMLGCDEHALLRRLVQKHPFVEEETFDKERQGKFCVGLVRLRDRDRFEHFRLTHPMTRDYLLLDI